MTTATNPESHRSTPRRDGTPSDDGRLPGDAQGDPLVVDCDACRMRDTDACGDCVVGVLLADGPLLLDAVEQDALDALAGAGLVPRLRLVAGGEGASPAAE